MSKETNNQSSNSASESEAGRESIHIQVVVKSDADDDYLSAIDFTMQATTREVHKALQPMGVHYLEFQSRESQPTAFVVALDNFDDAFSVWKIFALDNPFVIGDVRINAGSLAQGLNGRAA